MNKNELIKNLMKCFGIILFSAIILFFSFFEVKNYIDWNNIYSAVIGYFCISVVFIFWVVVFDFQYYKIKFHIKRYKKSKLI